MNIFNMKGILLSLLLALAGPALLACAPPEPTDPQVPENEQEQNEAEPS